MEYHETLFSDKGLNRRNITLIDGDYIISKDSDVATIQKDANHPSILKINETIEKIKFSFNEIEIGDIESEITNLNSKKANTFNCVPTKIIEEYKNV